MGTGESLAPPKPAEIRAARVAAGLSVTDAAALVHTYDRRWRHWECGKHRMEAAVWELFQIKLAARAEAST